MRYILISIIHLYWYLIPPHKRKTCIFSTSCSNHVKENLIKKGALAGIKSLIFRTKNCKSGYVVKRINGEIFLYTIRNVRIDAKDVCPTIIQHFEMVEKLNSM